MNPKTTFKWLLVDIISAISSKSLAKDTDSDNDLFVVNDYSKLPKLYGIKNITTEEVMDKLDMSQENLEK